MTFYTRLTDDEYRSRLTKLLGIISLEADRDDLKRLRARSIKGRASNKKRWTSPR